jgi:DnaJ-class molecular chaperone
MKICNRCRAAQNHLSDLAFVESPEGDLCQKCFDAHYAKAAPAPSKGEPLVVIVCPDCRGQHHAQHGKPCKACAGYGAVRIAANALAVYRPGRKSDLSAPQLLMEEGKSEE